MASTVKKNYRIGGEAVTAEVPVKKSGDGLKFGDVRVLTMIPVIRLVDGAHLLVISQVDIKSKKGSHTIYDYMVDEKFGNVFNISDDDYRDICNNYRRANGIHNRTRVSIPYTNHQIHSGLIKQKWNSILRRLTTNESPKTKTKTKTKTNPWKRTKSTQEPENQGVTAFKHMIIEAVMDEVGERIPQAVMDGFQTKLESLKNDIISEVLTRVIEHVDEKLELKGMTERKPEAAKRKDTATGKVLPLKPRPTPTLQRCVGLYSATDFVCNGGNGELPCNYRDNCIALTAIRVRDGVTEANQPQWLDKIRPDVDAHIEAGLELVTNPGETENG